MTQLRSLYHPLLTNTERIAREIGNTPLLPLKFLSTTTVQVYAKAEWKQLSGSVKARAAYNIIHSAIASGQLNSRKRLLDASSGNTAIAYATILERLGIGCTICIPSNASVKRIKSLEHLGVEIVFTSPLEGTEGARSEARRLAELDPDLFYYADQYSNNANSEAHYLGTAQEILDQTQGRITHFVAGLGTTGTFSGTARGLKERSGITAIALQPDGPLHIMEGWKHLETSDVPEIYEPQWIDAMQEVSSEEAFEMIKTLYSEEGLRLSPSSAANVVGAKAVAQSLEHGIVVTVLPDSIERYSEIEQQVFGG